jgi:hypothetical protein
VVQQLIVKVRFFEDLLALRQLQDRVTQVWQQQVQRSLSIHLSSAMGNMHHYTNFTSWKVFLIDIFLFVLTVW